MSYPKIIKVHENYPSTYLTNILGYIFIWGVNNGLHSFNYFYTIIKKKNHLNVTGELWLFNDI